MTDKTVNVLKSLTTLIFDSDLSELRSVFNPLFQLFFRVPFFVTVQIELYDIIYFHLLKYLRLKDILTFYCFLPTINTRTTTCLQPTTDNQLPATYFRQLTSDNLLPTTDYRLLMELATFRLRNYQLSCLHYIQ
jgi:hypothetical protein